MDAKLLPSQALPGRNRLSASCLTCVEDHGVQTANSEQSLVHALCKLGLVWEARRGMYAMMSALNVHWPRSGSPSCKLHEQR